MFLFLTEIFPIKSTGSFFTTGNATYLFLIMTITIALARKYNKLKRFNLYIGLTNGKNLLHQQQELR